MPICNRDTPVNHVIVFVHSVSQDITCTCTYLFLSIANVSKFVLQERYSPVFFPNFICTCSFVYQSRSYVNIMSHINAIIDVCILMLLTIKKISSKIKHHNWKRKIIYFFWGGGIIFFQYRFYRFHFFLNCKSEFFYLMFLVNICDFMIMPKWANINWSLFIFVKISLKNVTVLYKNIFK